MTEQQRVNLSKGHGGRPPGQFLYHKLCVLKYLQEYQATNGKPYEGGNDDLSMCMGEWGMQWRVGVSNRQVARYLSVLQSEKIPGTDTPRIEVSHKRFGAKRGSRRMIVVNDLRPLNI